jgi:hypothetical protein
MIKKAIAGQVHETVGERVNHGKVFGGASRPNVISLVVGDRPKPSDEDSIFSVVTQVALVKPRNNLLELIEQVRDGTLKVGKRGGTGKSKAPAPPPDGQFSLF